MTSSRRFKEDINPMNNASDALFALNPVTFHYKKDIDPTATSQFGLVAEDGEQVNAMLLDEFLKEHKKVQEQQATIAELKSNLENLAATVKQQASELKDVRMQLQIECSASVAANNR